MVASKKMGPIMRHRDIPHQHQSSLLRVAGIRRITTHTTDTFLFISHTTNVFLFKFRCNIFIGVRIIEEMLGSVASGTHCISSNTLRVKGGENTIGIEQTCQTRNTLQAKCKIQPDTYSRNIYCKIPVLFSVLNSTKQ